MVPFTDRTPPCAATYPVAQSSANRRLTNYCVPQQLTDFDKPERTTQTTFSVDRQRRFTEARTGAPRSLDTPLASHAPTRRNQTASTLDFPPQYPEPRSLGWLTLR